VDEGLITTNQFIFLKGSATEFSIGSYGIQSVASVGNNPGKRNWTTSWEANGKMYVFGGEGFSSQNGSPTPPGGYMNDLWEYDPTTNNWRWLKGSNFLGASATSGTQGVAAVSNTPGSRKAGMGWSLNGKIYLFGGFITYIYLGHVNDFWEYDIATGNWRLLNGSPTSINLSPVYGTQGVFNAANNPGGREGSSTWTYNGKLYLFGGSTRISGVDVKVNDLWEYDPAVNQWRWLSGPQTGNNYETYGVKGIANTANIPGSRIEASVSNIGSKVYLYGGDGYAISPSTGPLDDLWEYDHSTGNWTWVAGGSNAAAPKVTGTQGIYGPAVTPGARAIARMTVSNNTLFLYGGFTWYSGFHADLWQFDPAISQWRWVKGPASVNQLGNYGFAATEDPSGATFPGARYDVKLSTINNNLYLFGGRGYNGISSVSDESQNDLRKFNTATNNWTWMKGYSGKQYYAAYGTKGIAASTNQPGTKNAASSVGANGKFYLFGGSGSNTYPNGGISNDLWEYDPTTNNWKWLKGSSTNNSAGSYGTIGVASATNEPPFRTNAMMWNIGNKIYMFGGTIGANYNDLWEYDLTTNNWTWLKGSNTQNQSGIYGTKTVAAPANTPGARWQGSAFTYNNKLYLFSGNGYNSNATSGELNDLWEYDPATNNWTWLSGNDAINSFGVYGTINVAAPTNIPGSRETAQLHTIGLKAYLFGGRGYASSGGFQNLNDTWEYDFATNQWTWKKGLSTGGNSGVAGSYGIEDPANYPIARYHATGWALSGKMYLFSGTFRSGV